MRRPPPPRRTAPLPVTVPLDPRIARLRGALLRRDPLRAHAAPDVPRAAVALLVRPAPAELEILLIRRAVREGDPWSGHMAFPGGRAQPGDADLAHTAARETHEEVGIDPRAGGAWLGALDDLAPASGVRRIVVQPHVFAVAADAEPVPDPREVDAALWISLGELADPAVATEYLHVLEGGARMRLPAFGTRGQVIWGMTHRMLSQFLELHSSTRDEGSGT